MDIQNRTIVFLGSSVTYGGENWSMCDFIRETTGANVIKWAVSGTTLVDTDAKSYVSRLKAEIDKQDTCDSFICQLSTNDAARQLPLGQVESSMDIEDFDTQTIIGAMEFIIATARKKWNCPIAFYTGTWFEKPHYQKMVDALLKLAEKWNIDVIDLWNDPQMREITPEKYKVYMRDPVHPTKLGYIEWWGPKFLDYLERTL